MTHTDSTQNTELHKPNYYAVLTAEVRYDRHLCANAKLLYAELTALTQVSGYCWATNGYFADLYNVDERTIKRWLQNLVEQNYIEIETKKDGMRWERKIFLKNCLRRDNSVQTKGQKCPDRRDKNVPIINKQVNTKKDMFVAEGSGDPPRSENSHEKGENEEIDESLIYKKIIAKGVKWSSEEIRYAIDALKAYKGKVFDWWRFLEGTVEKFRNKKRSQHAATYKPKHTKKRKIGRLSEPGYTFL